MRLHLYFSRCKCFIFVKDLWMHIMPKYNSTNSFILQEKLNNGKIAIGLMQQVSGKDKTKSRDKIETE